MAKLVDLLAKYLVEWPDGAEYMCQGFGGYIYDQEKRKLFFIKEFASDAAFATVSKAQYLAARDRLHAETVKDMREPTNAYTDQALWDKVAVALAPAVYAECCKGMDATGYPENWREGVAKDWVLTVDAFMADRAKRLKGGV